MEDGTTLQLKKRLKDEGKVIMKRKCYISYKFEDKHYKKRIVDKWGGEDFIDRSQQEIIDSDDPEYIMQQIRERYLKDSTVTIFLIGTKSGENYRDPEDIRKGYDSQIIIRREITSSLYNGNGNSRSGLLGVVLPEMESKIYTGRSTCECCGATVTFVNINNDTVIKEFGQNYYLKKHALSKCTHYGEDDRYAVLVRYSEFMSDPEKYIEMAFEKRSMPIAQNVRVRNFE